MGWSGRQAGPAARRELAIGIGESRRGGDRAIAVERALLVAHAVQGRQHLFRKLACGVQYGAHQVGVIVGKAAGGGDVADAGDGLKREGQVTNGGAEGHGAFLKRCVFFRF